MKITFFHFSDLSLQAWRRAGRISRHLGSTVSNEWSLISPTSKCPTSECRRTTCRLRISKGKTLWPKKRLRRRATRFRRIPRLRRRVRCQERRRCRASVEVQGLAICRRKRWRRWQVWCRDQRWNAFLVAVGRVRKNIRRRRQSFTGDDSYKWRQSLTLLKTDRYSNRDGNQGRSGDETPFWCVRYKVRLCKSIRL